ncbi:uncharacterized protein LOC123980890 isoform X2 [Micropterus dolomieu]|uniref:uncharacterized protein LOC123980890 isoform X2 n=1 Tax=Micropterus dolomieu TaxID=147949 RepID=UPI001E8CA7D6|nr:uncharacterized protein LOC123980890 isoform X2 [Micropterus dolomieu]
MEDRLIVSVRGHSVLYDSSSYLYRDRAEREMAWCKVSEEVGLSAFSRSCLCFLSEEICRRKWRGLRDTYLKEKRKEIEKRNVCGKRWKHSEVLSFLDPFFNVTPRETRCNDKVREVEEDDGTSESNFTDCQKKMATGNGPFVSSADRVDQLAKAEILRGFIAEKLTTAAQEIFAVVERTVAGYEEEASGLRQEIDRQRRQLEAVLQPRVSLCRTGAEDSGSQCILEKIVKKKVEEEEEESAEEPEQSTSLDEEDLSDPDYQLTNTRCQFVQRERGHLNLRVCLLKDCRTNVLSKYVLRSPMQRLRCPRGLQESEFLDILRSTFPQLTGQFDAFTADSTRILAPLKLKTMTPEVIKWSIKSRGKGRSALYLRPKRSKKSLTSQEQRPSPQTRDTSDTRYDENRPHANAVEKVEINEEDCLSSNSGWQLQVKIEEDVEDLGCQYILHHIKEEEGEDEESAKEPVQTTSPEEEHPGDPDHQIPNSRGQSVQRNCGMWAPLNLRVCLLEDSHTTVLSKGVLKSPLLDLRCPRGLQEDDFLDLLRSTFPQLTGRFDAFTTDATRKLAPLKLKTLTPEEIQRSIKSRGKGRSALYIRAQRANKSLTSQEQRSPQGKDTDDTRNYENRPHANAVEKDEEDPLSAISRWQLQVKIEEDEDQIISKLILDPAESEVHNEDGDDVDRVEEDEGDDDRKQDKNDVELREREDEQSSSKMMRKRRVEHSGIKTKKRKRVQSSLNKSDAPLSCKVCRALHNSMKILIKHAWSHVDDPERLCGVCGEHPESVEELRSHLQSHQKTHRCGKSFLTAVGLNGHAAVHTGERPYKCDVCHEAFKFKASLKTHRWKHVEDKPHKCDVCDQAFAFKQQLRIHSRTHTGEKPYSCHVCRKSVRDFRALAYHKLGHTGKKRYGCQFVGSVF